MQTSIDFKVEKKEDKEVNIIFKKKYNCLCGMCIYISYNKINYVKDAKISLIRKKDNKEVYKTESTSDGKYFFYNIRPDTYYIKAIRNGYKSYEKSSIFIDNDKVYLEDIIF